MRPRVMYRKALIPDAIGVNLKMRWQLGMGLVTYRLVREERTARIMCPNSRRFGALFEAFERRRRLVPMLHP